MTSPRATDMSSEPSTTSWSDHDSGLLATQPAIEVLLSVAYDGSDFVGYQQQPGAPGTRSVEGVLLAALGSAFRLSTASSSSSSLQSSQELGSGASSSATPSAPLALTLASSSRTDAGVHARDLVVKTSAIAIAGGRALALLGSYSRFLVVTVCSVLLCCHCAPQSPPARPSTLKD